MKPEHIRTISTYFVKQHGNNLKLITSSNDNYDHLTGFHVLDTEYLMKRRDERELVHDKSYVSTNC
jgi:hypothetical protein